jgi:hypothetical protein
MHVDLSYAREVKRTERQIEKKSPDHHWSGLFRFCTTGDQLDEMESDAPLVL